MSMLSEQMKQVVERVRLGFVATVCPDGTPNVSPKGTLCVLDDEHLIFADLRSPGTIANLRSNANVEINVVDSFNRKGYRFKGVAVVHERGAAFDDFVGFFSRRKLADAPRRIRAVVVIRVASAKPLISPGYDQGTTEEDMTAQWKQYYLGRDLTAV
jgi:uncharacterized protein